jgi:uncharacterized SAM-binding protein YcdF (DUF218 family)
MIRRLAAVAVLCALVALIFVTPVGRLLLRRAAHWLVVRTPVDSVDLIVALGGDRGRQETAVELLRRGIGPRVVFLGADSRERDYECLGVPAAQAVGLLPPAYTTGEEADRVRDLVRARGYRSVLIVTAPYHSRRALWIFRRALRGTGVTVEVETTVVRAFQIENWWTTHMGQKTIGSEYLGLAYYWMKNAIG